MAGVSFWENLAYVRDIINSGFVCPVNHPNSGTVIAEVITHSQIETNTHTEIVIFGFVMFGKVLGMINKQFGGDFQSMELYDLSHMKFEMKWTIDGLV